MNFLVFYFLPNNKYLGPARGLFPHLNSFKISSVSQAVKSSCLNREKQIQAKTILCEILKVKHENPQKI